MTDLLPATREGGELEALAAGIRYEVEAAEADFQSAVAHALRAGELLIEAKAQVRHGDWLSWLKENCPLGEREAQNYIRLARNPKRVADLPSVRGAIAELTAPKPDPDPADSAMRAFEERIRGMDMPTVEEAINEFRASRDGRSALKLFQRVPRPDKWVEVAAASTKPKDLDRAIAGYRSLFGWLRVDSLEEAILVHWLVKAGAYNWPLRVQHNAVFHLGWQVAQYLTFEKFLAAWSKSFTATARWMAAQPNGEMHAAMFALLARHYRGLAELPTDLVNV